MMIGTIKKTKEDKEKRVLQGAILVVEVKEGFFKWVRFEQRLK